MVSISLGCLYKSIDIFGESVSVMGMSAAILILTNIVAWPSILEEMYTLDNVSLEDSEMVRAKSLVNQIELILNFCSALMQ